MLTWTYNSNSTFSIKLPRPCYDWQESREMLGTWSEKTTGLCGKNSQVADPLPPSLGIFRFFLPFFLPFYKPLNWKKQRKYGVGLGQTPPPPLGILPT